MESTPRANRLHIGIFGRRNSGKSSLINALCGQQTAIVSDVAGTTTDAVFKSMEIHGLGPCVLIDTAGFDDDGELGSMRVAQTRKVAEQTDVAIVICNSADCTEEQAWMRYFAEQEVPVVPVLNKIDLLSDVAVVRDAISKVLKQTPICVSTQRPETMAALRQALIAVVPEHFQRTSIVGDLVVAGDTVLLVMPQDAQAPAGRLILPQVQTIRDLLNKPCTVVCCTADGMEAALASLKQAPTLIITDSQVFGIVYDRKPAESRLTSFSVLFAQYKGDIEVFIAGARAIDTLTEQSRVLIAEACTHAPLSEDIGRVKIPALLRRRVGVKLQIDIVAGNDFPADLSPYSLVIHCGACMFNRRHVLHRIAQAQAQHVPITNYGICIAHLKGILDKIVH